MPWDLPKNSPEGRIESDRGSNDDGQPLTDID